MDRAATGTTETTEGTTEQRGPPRSIAAATREDVLGARRIEYGDAPLTLRSDNGPVLGAKGPSGSCAALGR
jgi:hypothetical protein